MIFLKVLRSEQFSNNKLVLVIVLLLPKKVQEIGENEKYFKPSFFDVRMKLRHQATSRSHQYPISNNLCLIIVI